VHVWFASVAQLSPLVHALYGLLSVDEQHKTTRYADNQRRQQYIAGRGLLRALLSGYLDSPPQKIVLAYSPLGKPFVADDSRLNFNVSHSHDMVALAFAKDRRVGIDVQKMDMRELTPQIVNRVFAPSESSGLRGFDDQQKQVAFSRTWVVKEAYVKGIGCGLSQPFNELEVSLASDERPRLRTTGKGDSRAPQWELREPRLREGYAAALAVEGHGWRLKCRPVDAIPG